MDEQDSQQFLDSVMVIERETVPVEFYGDPKKIFETTGSITAANNTVWIEVPKYCLDKLQWGAGDSLQWDIVDQETVIICKRRR